MQVDSQRAARKPACDAQQRRAKSPAAAARTRQARSAAPRRVAERRCASDAAPRCRPTSGTACAATRAAGACRRRPERRSPRGSIPASLRIRRPASSARTVWRGSSPTNSGDSRAIAERGCGGQRAGGDCRWRKPCWAIASPRLARSRSQAATSGRRSESGCRSRAGITSSVTRPTPRSSSQSRISAARSNVAGSMSWTATARSALRPHRGPACGRAVKHAAVAGGEALERSLPRPLLDAATGGAPEPPP